jgi:BirA family biotin operon repressor/biotin-[acetyl-CoA-carboxylase] ligase
LSLSRTFGGGLARLGGLSLVAGIAVAEALHAFGFGSLRLKWPNDLVVGDATGPLRKVGGLLVEGGGEHAGPARAVIGLGLNVRMPAAAAAAIDQPWCDLAGMAEAGAPVRNAVVTALRRTCCRHWSSSMPRAWRRSCHATLRSTLAGHPVTMQGSHGDHAGTRLAWLMAPCALRLRLADGSERNFHAGEVSVRRHGLAA